MSHRFLRALLLGAITGSAAFSIAAQPAWPAARPITIVVPFSAGGSVDATARLVGQKLGERLKQTVVVENLAGAGGVIGVAKAVQAAPDGYTLVLGADSPIAIARLVTPVSVRYDAQKDLTPIGLVTTAPMVIVARPGLAASSLGEVIDLARAQPGKLSYGTSGIGTVLQLAMEMIKELAKVDIVHVPYRGGAQIVSDVIGNQLDLAMLVSISAVSQVQSKRLKAIAVTSDKRVASLPDVPTVAETPGFKGFNVVAWTGLFAPAHTPPAIVERLSRELDAVLRSDEVRDKLAEQGAVPGSGAPGAFASFVAHEEERYARIVKAANIHD
jgi:tripartite-type tricarboxylate transporter receptor subunit TctC